MSTFKVRKGNNIEPITKTFRIPAETINKLDVLASINGLSLNQLVNQALEYAIDNIELDEYQKAEYEKRIIGK